MDNKGPNYKTCRHSTGNAGELIVYVHQTCPRYTKIRGSLVSSKIRCDECEEWERRKTGYINSEFEVAVEEMSKNG